MFTNRFYRLVEVICIISCLLGSNCVIFHRKKKLFFSMWFTRLWLKFTFCWCVLMDLFMILRTLQVKWTTNDIRTFNECYILTLLWTLGCISLGVCVTHIHESCAMLNQMIRFAINFKKKWIIKYDPKMYLCGDPLDRVIITTIILGNFIAWLSVFIYSLNTNLPLYPHTILPAFIRDHIIIIILVGLGILYAATTFAWVFVMLITVGGAYLSSSVPVFTKEFRAGLKTYTTHDELRSPVVFSVMYRSCEILHFFFIEIGGIVLLPFQVLVSQFILIVNFTLLWYSEYLKDMDKVRLTIFAFAFQFVWFIILELAGRYHLNSCIMVKSFKYHKSSNPLEKKFLSKYAKSCRPLWIGTKGYFKIKRLTVLKFLRGIVKGTLNMILAAKSRST